MKPFVAPWALAIVTGVASVAPALPFDHLDCRRVRDPRPRDRVRADLIAREPSLVARGDCTITLPARYLCTATSADVASAPQESGPGPDAHDYLCYRTRCRHDRLDVSVRDRFGDRTLDVKRTGWVCAPLESPGGGATTTTTIATTTTTTLPSSTTTTTQPAATSTTSSSTTTTTTAPPSTTTSTSSTSSTTTSTIALPEPPSHGCPVVNEVMTGSAASASEELIEILNPCGVSLDLAGARVLYQSASGATQRTLVTWEAGTVLGSGARLLLATSNYGGPADGTFSSGLSGSGGGVAVADSDGLVVDGVGYGAATNAFVEGSTAPAPAAGSVIARIPDGADTDDGASDWQEAAPTPGAPN